MDPARMDPGTQPLLGSGVHCSYTTTDTDVCVCVCLQRHQAHTPSPTGLRAFTLDRCPGPGSLTGTSHR